MNASKIKKLAHSIHAKVIETHISWVLISDDCAYKIKKPIKTNFLDFSTLRLRKYYCEEELRLNKEFSNDVYLDVVPIYQGEIISFNNAGSVIDYAVKMKVLDQDEILEHLLIKNEVKKSQMIELAEIIAKLHLNSPIISINKSPSLIHEFEDLFIEAQNSKILSISIKNKIAYLNLIGQSFIINYKQQFTKREDSGMIREVHGDLHSKNIFMTSPPILFDRIEFNKEFRRIDVLNEIAFICMDLEYYSRQDLSDAFLKEYIDTTKFFFGEVEQNIFIFYKAYVANVRAKVSLLQTGQSNYNQHIKEFKKYYTLCEGYLKAINV